MVDQVDLLDAQGPDIGGYTHATFHKDGQMSTIFRASPRKAPSVVTKDLIALKVTVPSAMLAPHNSEREARILREAQDDHVIALLETFWEPGGRFVLVFPFMPLDLSVLLQTHQLTSTQKLEVVSSLFQALAHIHSFQIIHRDIKPSNILLRSMHGPAYLADFGISWSPRDKDSEAATQKITDVGTTSYRPPELLFGCTDYDTSLDIWAAGCVVSEIMAPSQRPLFDAGPLGSELGLIKSIFTTLGTPNDKTWPASRQLCNFC